MDIQHSSHRKLFEANHRNTPFYNLFAAEEDLITELVSLINSLFAPLTWILEETLYRRIKKEDKGWIQINFLHRNKRLKSIFNKFEIPPHCRRRKNILNKAIQQSIIKRKRDLIKRREFLNINQEMKKVIYLQARGLGPKQINVNQSLQSANESLIKNCMQQIHLKKMIAESIKHVLTKIERTNLQNQIQMDNQPHKQIDLQKIISEAVLEGSLFHQQIHCSETNGNTQTHVNQTEKQENCLKEVTYRWCFVYFPSLDDSALKEVISLIQRGISDSIYPQKIDLQDQMQNLILTEKDLNKQSQQIPSNLPIKLYTLQQMISIHYPKYSQMCNQIGYKKVDLHKQKLRIRQKQREKRKARLLQSRYLDNKVDLVNEYHVKLEIEKQRKAYWEKRNREIEEKIRKRQQRRRNRINKDEVRQQPKNLTDKLKILLNIDQPKPEITERILQDKKPFLFSTQIQSSNNQIFKLNQAVEIIDGLHEEKAPGIKIKLPKFSQQDQNGNDVHQIVQKNNNFERQLSGGNVDQLYDEDDLEQECPLQSSGEEFQIPKKRLRKHNETNSKSNINKHKKIVKQPHDSRKSQVNKKQNCQKNQKNTVSNGTSKKVNHNSNHQSNLPSSNSLQQVLPPLPNINSTYNLRHKSPSVGSYLKMVDYSYADQQPQKNGEQAIYHEQNDQQPRTNGRNSSSRQKKRLSKNEEQDYYR